MRNLVTEQHLEKLAVDFVRQSSPGQVRKNVHSRKRQMNLTTRATELGWPEDKIMVIDEDLGVSAKGFVDRQGFGLLRDLVLEKKVGITLCVEVSRISRNDPEWALLIQLCKWLDVLLADEQRIYNLNDAGDTMTLRILASVAAYEGWMVLDRLQGGYWIKANEGALYSTLAPGYALVGKHLEKHPDSRVRETIKAIFQRFESVGVINQVHQWLVEADLEVPTRPSMHNPYEFTWCKPQYGQIHSILTNPVYSGAYVYGRSEVKLFVDEQGNPEKRKIALPMDEWKVVKKDAHEAYLTWEQFVLNLEKIESNNSAKQATGSTGKRGSALLSGLLRCGRCGYKLSVKYHSHSKVRYRCNRGGKQRAKTNICLSIPAALLDEKISEAVFEAVSPVAVDGALRAQELLEQCDQQQLGLHNDRLEQLRWECGQAQRRYENVDPENRLVAANLEKIWNDKLAAAEEQQDKISRYQAEAGQTLAPADKHRLAGLARNFHRVWFALSCSPQHRKDLMSCLIEEITVNQDEADLTAQVHWKGGRFTEYALPLKAACTGRHTGDDLPGIVTFLRQILDDSQIAAALNRSGLQSANRATWTGQAVEDYRQALNIAPHSPVEKHEKGLLMQREVADITGLSQMTIHRMIKRGDLPAVQVRPGLPYVIRKADLESKRGKRAIQRAKGGKNAPLTPPAKELPLLKMMEKRGGAS